jgi:hypothetical protein
MRPISPNSANSTSPSALFDPEALGFEFTLEQIELRALDLQPDLFHDWAVEQQ